MENKFKYLFKMFSVETETELFFAWTHAKFLSMPKRIKDAVLFEEKAKKDETLEDIRRKYK